MDSWLDGTNIDKNFGPDLPLLFIMHDIGASANLEVVDKLSDVRF